MYHIPPCRSIAFKESTTQATTSIHRTVIVHSNHTLLSLLYSHYMARGKICCCNKLYRLFCFVLDRIWHQVGASALFVVSYFQIAMAATQAFHRRKAPRLTIISVETEPWTSCLTDSYDCSRAVLSQFAERRYLTEDFYTRQKRCTAARFVGSFQKKKIPRLWFSQLGHDFERAHTRSHSHPSSSHKL